eukprot:2989429-Pyramimonas_sp.AAC.1
MAYQRPIRHPSHTLRGPTGSSTEGPNDTLRVACPHPMRHIPHTFRDPTGNFTEGPNGRVRTAYAHPVGAPSRTL